MILVDDMGWSDGGCFGSRYYRTPNIDALAGSGLRFTQAYAAAAVCSPTRAALLTGKAPARLHLTDWVGGEPVPAKARFRLPPWQKHLPREEVTLPEVLKTWGYATAHIGKWHLGGEAFLPQNHGFDTNIAGGAIGHPASYFWPYGETNHDHRVPGLAEAGAHSGEYLTDRLTDEAIKFVRANRGRPFFLNLWHYAVHGPLMGKPEFVDEAGGWPGAAGQSNRIYYAMLRSVDESVGRVLSILDELQLATNTIVVFTSDNGGAVHFGRPPATSNSPLRDGKGTPYEGGLRVPLVVRVPGVTRPGTVCSQPVITMDFFPTLLELAGAGRSALRSGVDGICLVPFLRGRGSTTVRELCWHYPHYWNGGRVSPYSVIRDGAWKLIRFYETGREELYDLGADEAESRDLSVLVPGRRRELGARLDRWLRQVGAQMPVGTPSKPADVRR